MSCVVSQQISNLVAKMFQSIGLPLLAWISIMSEFLPFTESDADKLDNLLFD